MNYPVVKIPTLITLSFTIFMPINKLINSNFLEYASYVIKERAIPDINDGFKPVQRRIFHTLNEMYDGKFSKVANIIGHCMRYHPHGDASIGDALVVLANKEYFIEKQGNFGNILTGDSSSAARYIEARLSPLAKEVLFNKEITEYVDSYDGRNKEPVTLPAKVPVLLMMGADGIAVGMSTKILPHNFGELLKSQIAYLKEEEFEIFPDFLQGGLVDVSEYKQGKGKVRCRAQVEKQGKKLIVKEISYGTNVESLINSIEDAVRRGKIKISKINDYTTDKVEIELDLARGADVDATLEQLYLYTDCETSINSNILVIQDSRPVEMTIPQVIKHTTDRLVEKLQQELEIELNSLINKLHMMTLEQIFIKNRLYKKIENCTTYEDVKKAILKSLKKFALDIGRDVTDEDIETLLAIKIKRISKFDIEKHKLSMDKINLRMAEIRESLSTIISFSINYIQSLLDRFGKDFPRKTKLQSFNVINASEVALSDVQVFYDKKTGYLGTEVKSGVEFKCTSFDKVIIFDSKYVYKVMQIPDKLFVGKLIHVEIYNKETVFNILYQKKENEYLFIKRFIVSKYITDKSYTFLEADTKIKTFTIESDHGIKIFYEPGKRVRKSEDLFLFNDFLIKGVQAKGVRISTKAITNIKLVKKLPVDKEKEMDKNKEGIDFS